MDGVHSGLYDHPELSNLRRVKPLPKRRRTAMINLPSDYDPSATIAGLPIHDPQALAALAEYHTRQYYNPVAHGLPPGMTVKDLFAGIEGAAAVADSIARTSSEFSSLYASAVAAAAAHTGPIPNLPLPPEDDDNGESDYVDHLQVPLNTKKRKVPGLHNRLLALSDSANGGGGDGPQDTSEGGLLLAAHRRMADGPENVFSSTTAMTPHALSKRNTRGSQVTLAALQRKEVVYTRKREFATVLESVDETNQLALELALLGRFPQLDGVDPKVPPLRGARRANRLALKENQALPSDSSVPTRDFTFEYPSTSSERAISTREEVAQLRKRFEEELSLQATRAAEAAAKHAAMMEPPPKNRKRAAGGTARTAFPPRLDSDAAPGDQGLGKGRQKKKKRSALANASNPHHLRNYVPSRLPQQPPPLTQASLNAANFLTPPPLRFLLAEIPPKRRKKGGHTPTPLQSTLTQPLDEWICASCEYNLFYGEELAFGRAVKNRKKILSRRRRARERAAAAAAGGAVAPALPPSKDDYPDGDEAEVPRKRANGQTQSSKRERQYAGADATDTLR